MSPTGISFLLRSRKLGVLILLSQMPGLAKTLTSSPTLLAPTTLSLNIAAVYTLSPTTLDLVSSVFSRPELLTTSTPVDVNLRAVINFVHLALSAFRKYDRGGSIVITASATGYSPEHSLPVYSAAKAGVLGLIRALRPSLPYTHNVVINGVAPAATITRLLPKNLAAPIVAAGSPVSTAEHVGLAVAWSAVGTEERQVDRYGRDPDEVLTRWPGRWNGRIILTLGDTWTEVEGPLADRKAEWLGEWQAKSTANQQVLTDMRPLPNPHSNN